MPIKYGSKSDEIEREIKSALRTLEVPASGFVRSTAQVAADVVQKTKATFVVDNPRVWWLSLRLPAITVPFPDCSGFQHLLEYIPEGQKRCWFIPETGGKCLPAFDVDVLYIVPVLGECFAFEYYLVGHEFDWLIIENDHNCLIVSTPPGA